MIWIFKFVITSILLFILIWFGVLNSHTVEFYLIPNFINFKNFDFLQYPLYIIITFSVLFGFILGCVLENNRSNKIRKSLKQKISELNKSDVELQRLKKKLNKNNEDILSLLE